IGRAGHPAPGLRPLPDAPHRGRPGRSPSGRCSEGSRAPAADDGAVPQLGGAGRVLDRPRPGRGDPGASPAGDRGAGPGTCRPAGFRGDRTVTPLLPLIVALALAADGKEPEKMKATLVRYSGNVQGVGFRATAVMIGRDHPEVGYVKNLSD